LAKTFEHYHLSLIERDQADLLVPPIERDEFIRAAFAEGFSFRHMGNSIHWVPSIDAAPFIVGNVTRQKVRTQHRAPEEGADEFEAIEWQGSLVVIDPTYKPDGQKVAFEIDPAVGKPAALLDSILSHLNERPGVRYTIVAKALFDQETFWSFAQRHGHRLEYISFKFVVPNMFFGATTSIDQGLRQIGDDTNAEGVEVRLESDDGVQTESQTVTDAMNYAEEGGASVTAKAMNGDRYSSQRRRKTSKVIDVIVSNRRSLMVLLNKALGRDEDNSMVSPDSGDDNPSGD